MPARKLSVVAARIAIGQTVLVSCTAEPVSPSISPKKSKNRKEEYSGSDMV